MTLRPKNKDDAKWRKLMLDKLRLNVVAIRDGHRSLIYYPISKSETGVTPEHIADFKERYPEVKKILNEMKTSDALTLFKTGWPMDRPMPPMTTGIDTDKLAQRFTELLGFTKSQWREVVGKMQRPDYPKGCCPSHDYCDANMVMQEAFERLAIPLYTTRGQMREDARRAWNEAWGKAHELWLAKDWTSYPMTGDELRDARATLGDMWGLGRPLHMAEMGKALRLQGKDPGASVRDWERGHTVISGPVSVAVEAMLAGFKPGGLDRVLENG